MTTIQRDFIYWQRLEGALVFSGAIGLFLYTGSGLPWWAALLLFFAPDFSFLAYVLGPKMGAAAYNLVHIYGFGLVLMALGTIASIPLLIGLGALWLAHCGFDRALGYGLKSHEGFGITHLGRIGRHA